MPKIKTSQSYKLKIKHMFLTYAGLYSLLTKYQQFWKALLQVSNFQGRIELKNPDFNSLSIIFPEV